MFYLQKSHSGVNVNLFRNRVSDDGKTPTMITTLPTGNYFTSSIETEPPIQNNAAHGGALHSEGGFQGLSIQKTKTTGKISVDLSGCAHSLR